jgi:hypothetical protein
MEFRVGDDPTLHDFKPPTVEVRSIDAEGVQDGYLDRDAEYTVTYTVTDASGVARAVVEKGGGSDVERFDGGRETSLVRAAVTAEEYWAYQFERSTVGYQVSVRTVDVNGVGGRTLVPRSERRREALYLRLKHPVRRRRGGAGHGDPRGDDLQRRSERRGTGQPDTES